MRFGLKERPEPAFTDLKSFLEKLSQSQSQKQEDTTPVDQAFPQHYAPKSFPPALSSSPPRGSKSKVTKKAKAKMEKKSRKKIVENSLENPSGLRPLVMGERTGLFHFVASRPYKNVFTFLRICIFCMFW